MNSAVAASASEPTMHHTLALAATTFLLTGRAPSAAAQGLSLSNGLSLSKRLVGGPFRKRTTTRRSRLGETGHANDLAITLSLGKLVQLPGNSNL